MLAVASVCGLEMSSKNGSSLQILRPNSRFLLADPQKMQSKRSVSVKSAESQISLGIILATDKFLKNAFAAAAIEFPSALFGMFCIFTILLVLDSTVPDAAITLMNFFQPTLLFIQRWLPLIYVPSFVVLPLALKYIPASSGLKILCIIVGGWLASLSVAGFTPIAVRKMSVIFLISFVSSLLYPTLLGTNARACLPFLLASTVVGYIFGSGLPSAMKKVFHPIICCALLSELTVFAYGKLLNFGLNPVLGFYLTKVSSNPGAGDILMGFLGSVILSFAFSMFQQRKIAAVDVKAGAYLPGFSFCALIVV
ncbi:hypothetical protein ACS0TY_033327 [Phlomoides rotata]